MENLIVLLKKSKRLELTVTVFISCVLSASLVAFRIVYSTHISYVFLFWNLFLAFIPFALSTVLVLNRKRTSAIFFLSIVFFWLLFFPNAPYILTDFIHFRHRTDMPFWYDLALMVSSAFTGLFMGFISLMDMQAIISHKSNKLTGWFFSIFSIILGSFGIYLGRYLRFNSWDIISNPFSLFRDILLRIIFPLHYPASTGLTIVFSALLISAYLMMRQLTKLSGSYIG